MGDEYDIESPPPAEAWLAMEEAERVALIEEAHVRTRAPVGGSANAHASIHVVVETRLAEGAAPVVAAYHRCRDAGLDRHTTIHALSSVVTKHMLAIIEQHPGFDQTTADADFAALDPARFQKRKKS